MEEWMDGWMDEWMDGWMDGWMNGWMDGWMDGWRGPQPVWRAWNMCIHQKEKPAQGWRREEGLQID